MTIPLPRVGPGKLGRSSVLCRYNGARRMARYRATAASLPLVEAAFVALVAGTLMEHSVI